jgi:hypothetical protein
LDPNLGVERSTSVPFVFRLDYGFASLAPDFPEAVKGRRSISELERQYGWQI